MKNYKLFQFLIPGLLMLLLTGCSQDKVTDISACIESRIENVKDHACPNSNIIEYKFNHRNVFVISTNLCAPDAAAEVLDINCNVIGYLWGFAGNKKIEGIDFFDNSKIIRTLWEN